MHESDRLSACLERRPCSMELTTGVYYISYKNTGEGLALRSPVNGTSVTFGSLASASDAQWKLQRV